MPHFKTKHITIYLLIIIGLSLLSCKKDTTSPPDFHYEYAPVNIGHWNTFEVTEIQHSTLGSHDTLNYILKEIITEKINDNTFRLERFWKFSPADNWTIKDVWTIEKNTTTYNKTEENVKYTKLIFPIKKDISWNGNAFNSQSETRYKYNTPHTYYEINGLSFDSTVTIIQKDNFNAIEYQKAEETYAKNIGLIHKKYVDLSINLFDSTDINEGREVYYKLKAYGN